MAASLKWLKNMSFLLAFCVRLLCSSAWCCCVSVGYHVTYVTCHLKQPTCGENFVRQTSQTSHCLSSLSFPGDLSAATSPSQPSNSLFHTSHRSLRSETETKQILTFFSYLSLPVACQCLWMPERAEFHHPLAPGHHHPCPTRDPSRVHQVHQVHQGHQGHQGRQGHQGHQGRGPWAPGPAAAWPFRASWQRPWHSTSSPGRHHLGCVRDIFRLVSTYIWVDVGKCVHLLASCRIGWPKIQNYSANPGCKLDFQRTQRQKVHQKTAWRVERWRWSRPERHKSWHSSSHVLPCYTAPRGYWPNKHSRVPRLDHHSVKRCQR